jgi:hypothetical protein
MTVEVRTSRETVGEGKAECTLCDGVGYVYEDATPDVLVAINGTNERLDKRIEILTNSQEAKNG